MTLPFVSPHFCLHSDHNTTSTVNVKASFYSKLSMFCFLFWGYTVAVYNNLWQSKHVAFYIRMLMLCFYSLFLDALIKWFMNLQERHKKQQNTSHWIFFLHFFSNVYVVWVCFETKIKTCRNVRVKTNTTLSEKNNTKNTSSSTVWEQEMVEDMHVWYTEHTIHIECMWLVFNF